MIKANKIYLKDIYYVYETYTGEVVLETFDVHQAFEYMMTYGVNYKYDVKRHTLILERK